MPYSQKTMDLIKHGNRTSGNTLGRWAVHLDFPVLRIAYVLGVTRQTVYNWFSGKFEVFAAYQQRVELLTKIMATSATSEEAWKRICKAYELDPSQIVNSRGTLVSTNSPPSGRKK